LGGSLIFVDEFNVSEAILKPYSWCPIGISDYVFQEGRRKSLHVCVAVSLNEIKYIKIQNATYNAVRFIEYL